MNKFKPTKENLPATLQQRRADKLLVRLLRMLVKCSGLATSEEVEELHQQIREVNDSVEIIARHLKRQADERSGSSPDPVA